MTCMASVLPPAPAGTAAAGTAAPRAAAAHARGFCDLHLQGPPVQLGSVELLDRRVGFLRRSHLDEAEPPRTAGLSIGDDGGRFDGAGLTKDFAKALGRR